MNRFPANPHYAAQEATRQKATGKARARLLVADDNPRLLEQVTRVLGAEFDVVASADNGQDAVEGALVHAPDVLVLDISMPVMSGLHAAVHLRQKGSRIPIVFLTVHEDEEFVRAARAAGGLGYVLKSRMATDLVPAIRAALNGVSFVSKPLSN